MAIPILKLGIELHTSPKVLSTSLKGAAFEIENGRAFERYSVKGKMTTVHQLYPTRAFSGILFDSSFVQTAFIRDPVERFLSMYKNRVLIRRRDAARGWDRAVDAGLAEFPSLSELIDNLRLYRELVPEIQHHSEPQTSFLGSKMSFYDRVYRDDQSVEFEAWVSELLGKNFELPRLMVSEKREEQALDSRMIKKLITFYKDDYKAFGPLLRQTGK